MKVKAFFFALGLSASFPSYAATIAVLDSGITPIPEIQPFIEPGGINIDTGGPPIDDDPNRHGSLVSVIAIAASNGTARILPVKIQLVTNQPKAIDFASTHPRVNILNLSWVDAVFHVPTIDALARAASRGKLIVIAAGNSGRPDPDFPAGIVQLLNGRGLAVGAVGPAGVMRPYSARAGRSKEHYVVAPDGFEGLLGTSFAAPVVSGLAALLLEQSPFLSANDLASLIKRTTVDLGPPGVDAVYGHGMVTLDALSQPVGATSVASGNSVDGDAVTLSARTLRGSPAFAYALLDRSELLGETLIMDEYKRAFMINLSDTITVAENRTALVDLVSSRFLDSVDVPFGKSKLTMQYAPRSTSISELVSYDHEDYAMSFADINMSLIGNVDEVSFRFDAHRRSGTGFGATDIDDTAQLFSDPVFAAPYLSFAEASTSLNLGYEFNDKFALRFGVDMTDEPETNGLRSVSSIVRGEYFASNELTAGLQFGQTIEQGSLFGGSTGGVFSIDTAETNFIGLSVRYRLNPRFDLAMQYSEGFTAVDETANSLLKDVGSLRSRTYGMTLLGRDIFAKRDRFGIAVYSPLRVQAGSASLEVPKARDFDGNVFQRQERLDLEPTATETDVEMFYRIPLNKRLTLDTQLLYQHNPYHTNQVDDRVTLFTTIRTYF